MEANYGWTTVSQSTMTACMAGVIVRLTDIYVLGGILQGLRCSSVVVMLACSSGTEVVILETGGV
jgi:hypothetical protein